MRIKQLRGLTALTSDRRDKYRPRNCNGDAIGRLGLAVKSKVKHIKKNYDIAVGAPVIKQPSNGVLSGTIARVRAWSRVESIWESLASRDGRFNNLSSITR